jgi:hypothetical protein
MTTFMPILRDILFFAIWIGFPIAVFLPRMKKPGDIGRRMVMSVLGTWVALILHHQFISSPVSFALAKERGNIGYDGVGANVLIHLFGWMFGVTSTAVVASAYVGIEYLRKKRREHRDNL